MALLPASHAVAGKVKIVSGSLLVNGAMKSSGLVEVGATVENTTSAPAVLVFENGTVLDLQPGTKIVIKNFDIGNTTYKSNEDFGSVKMEKGASTTDLRLEYGEMMAKSKKLSRNSKFEVSTSVGVAGIRGSIGSFSHSFNTNTSTFANVEGDIYAGQLNGPAQNLNPGQTAIVSPTGITFGNLSPGQLSTFRNRANVVENQAANLEVSPEPSTPTGAPPPQPPAPTVDPNLQISVTGPSSQS